MADLPIIVISNLNSMINEPIKISAMGMQPREAVTFHLIKKINEERYLASWASFRADQDGKVALDELAPDHGTYRGIDGMALFWSMKPVTKNVMTQYFANTSIVSSSAYYVNKIKVSHSYNGNARPSYTEFNAAKI